MRLVTGEPHPMGNLAIVSDPDDSEVTAAAVRPLVERNLPAAVIYINGVAPSVGASLVADGFHSESMPAMAVDIARMTPTSLPPGYSFARTGIADSQDWTDALAKGYEIPPALAHLFSPEALRLDTTPDAETQCFAILKDGRAVATTLLYLADGLAGIYLRRHAARRARQGARRTRDGRSPALRARHRLSRRHPAILGGGALDLPAAGVRGQGDRADVRAHAGVMAGARRSGRAHEITREK